MEQLSIFSSARREAKLSTLGNNHETLNKVINWEIFRPMLAKAVAVEKPKGPGGRRRFDVVQKDTDARWARKNNQTYFGYKDHVKADAKSKLITNYSVTGASTNDNQEFIGLLDEHDEVIYADSGYVGQKYADQLPAGAINMIHEKAEKNRPLTENQKKSNREKSRIRCRIEHIFGYMTGVMHGITIRSVGMDRAKFNIGMMNLTYNLCRFTFLMSAQKAVCTMG